MKPRSIDIMSKPRQIHQSDMAILIKEAEVTTVADSTKSSKEEILSMLGGGVLHITSCQVTLSEVIQRILSDIGGGDDLILSTWAASGEDSSSIHNLLSCGMLDRATFITDPLFPRNAPTAAKMIVERFGPHSIITTRNHAKFAIVRKGGDCILVRTSMNLDSTPSIEYFSISTGKDVSKICEAVLASTRKTKARQSLSRGLLEELEPSPCWILSGGLFSFIDLIDTLRKKTGADTVRVCTWIASIAHLERLSALGCKVVLTMDTGMRKLKSGERLRKARDLFGNSVSLKKIHIKAAIIGDGLLVLTSANLNENPRCEDFRLITDQVAIGAVKEVLFNE